MPWPNRGNSAPVRITGGRGVGSVATAVVAQGWNIAGGQWRNDGVAISGATGLTYTRLVGDIGKVLTFVPTGLPFTANGGATTASVPDAPTIGTAVAGNGQAGVQFTAPAFNGGSAITMFMVYAYDAEGNLIGTRTTTQPPYPYPDLVNGVPVAFRVSAVNSVGEGPLSALSNYVTPVANIEPYIFARPAASLFNISDFFSNSNNLTSYNAQSAIRPTVTRSNIVVVLGNFIARIGNSNEEAVANNLRFRVGLEIPNADGSLRMARVTWNGGAQFIDIPGGSIQVVRSDPLAEILLANTNIRVKVFITAPDGVSQIQVPVYTGSDFNGTVLGAGSGEGVRVNAGDLSMTLNSGWGAKVGQNQYRPLAVLSADPAGAPPSALLIGDSTTAGSQSALPLMFHDANIAFVNMARSGESQLDWPGKAVGRSQLIKATKVVYTCEGINGFGSGAVTALAAQRNLWQYCYDQGAARVVQTQIPPYTPGSPGWATEAEQIPQSPVRPQFNADMATYVGTTGGPYALLQYAPVVSSADGLVWKGGYSYDGIHPTDISLSPSGVTALRNAGAAGNWTQYTAVPPT